MLLDGFGDGVGLAAAVGVEGGLRFLNRTAFGILQATRTRISRTEYISCPSCGRTLFDLQETTARIRAVTDHLKGVKIGIMGCIVNGPGEMADADYGYVGTGPGKNHPLQGERKWSSATFPEDEAVDALIDLIRTHGDWVVAPTAIGFSLPPPGRPSGRLGCFQIGTALQPHRLQQLPSAPTLPRFPANSFGAK